ncbi:MAG: hypothetical protein D6730_25570 [Bacteroidetes bacterium]|nr:MAG: hypothetical protein D6730_25570 [Bacteroidota bacterium]
MDEILLRLQQATRKSGKLKTLFSRLLEENHQLRQKIEQLEHNLQQLQQKHQKLCEQHDALKLAKSLEAPADRAIVMKKIDAYIKEIDACLKTFGD